MTSRSAALGAVLGLALGLAVSPFTSADAYGPHHVAHSTPASTVKQQAAARTEVEHRQVKRYWTAARMRAAAPVGADRADLVAETSTTAVQEAEQPQLGRLFFSFDGHDYTCSGTATQSANHDVVTTAAHCLSMSKGTWVTNVSFSPGYEDGISPYGSWTAETLVIATGWFTDQTSDLDAGFVVLDESATTGTSLTDAVGDYPITFSAERQRSWGLEYRMYGYPTVAPYDGRSLWSCHSKITNIIVVPDLQGLDCDLGPGSSGGPWIAEGSIRSVTSFATPDVPGVTWGAYFGAEVEAVYDEAQNYGLAFG